MIKQGWGWPGLAYKAHYFVKATSLCGKWMYTGEVEDDKHKSPDNCKACLRKLKKLYPEKFEE